MRKTTKEEVTMKIGKMNITFKPYDNSNILVTLKTNARGFKTVFKFSSESANEFYRFLCKNNTINNNMRSFKFIGLKIKHREYTVEYGEDELSMKYFNTQFGSIKITCLDGCTVIRIGDSETEKVYGQFCCDTDDFVDIISKNKQKINLMMGEHMMNSWN